MATKQERYEQFEDECTAAGLEVRHYSGRNYYDGPAVECADRSELIEIIRATTGAIQWDNLGLGWIVYPA